MSAAINGSLFQRIRPPEWEDFLKQPKSALLIGALSCSGCEKVKSALSTLQVADLKGWRLAYCDFPATILSQVLSQGVARSTPTIVANPGDGRLARLQGAAGSIESLRGDIIRFLERVG